jgi:hypothetical protein
MANDTNKTKPATRAKRTPSAASAKPTARPRPAKAAASAARKPVAKRAPATAKAATPASRKTAARPVAKTSPAVKKSAPAKKAAHEPAPFVAEVKKAGKPAKAKKVKLVRDSFTMPEPEYALIALLKKRCLNAGVAAKKSEILRAAVANLAKLSDASVLAAVRRLEVIKTGRPAKGSK